MKAQTRKQILEWMYDRIEQGVRYEEVGSCDSMDDADDFRWNCTVGEDDGRKVVFFTTSLSLFPFATGYMTKTGKPRIKWN